MTILVLTNQLDTHADMVLKALYDRERSYFRLNTERLHTDYDIVVSLEAENFYYSIFNKVNFKFVKSSEVTAIWWRRPERLAEDQLKRVPVHMHKHVKNEYFHLLYALVAVAENEGTRLLSNPYKMNRARDKAKQQIIANKVGFSIADGFFSNSQSYLLNKAKHPLIVKPLNGDATIANNDEIEHSIYTNELNPITLSKIRANEVVLDAQYFQKKLYPIRELRVNAFNGKIHAYEVRGAFIEGDYLDWRRAKPSEISFAKVPFQLERECLSYLAEFGLCFATFDFIEDDLGIHFLEINPNGQFLFLDMDGSNGLLTDFVDFLSCV